MSGVSAQAKVAQSTIEMVVTRADGTIENLGVVAYWHPNPLKRLAWRVRKLFK
jgi:hypothetical protein